MNVSNRKPTQEDDVEDMFAALEAATFDYSMSPSEAHNMCTECGIAMDQSTTDYRCPYCGLVKPNDHEIAIPRSDVASSSVRITTGANAGRFHSASSNYSSKQKKDVSVLLNARANEYKGSPISPDILAAAASNYNEIQKYVTEDKLDQEGNVVGVQKFVRRSNVRLEILAAIIYFALVSRGVGRKKKDISDFMGLNVQGFSRGEDIVRDIVSKGQVSFTIEDETPQGYVSRYLGAMNADKPNYSQFVVRIVEIAEKEHIGPTFQTPSKIAGAIWLLVIKCSLNFSAKDIEKHTDKTRSTTFIKFFKLIMKSITKFKPAFDECGVPM